MTRASVIIPSYNSWKTLEHTLRSVCEQTQAHRVGEVIVVDSSDDHKTKTLLRGWDSKGVKVIHAGRRVMPAISRNLGARAAENDVLVFIDSDAYFSNDWLEKMLTHYELGRRLGGGAIVPPDFQRNRMLALAQYFLQFNEYMDVGPARPMEFLPSCNMFCDRQLFLDVGGFPEIRAAEDVLFFKKVGANAQANVWFVHDARVFHIFREDFAAFLRNQVMLGKYVLIYRRRLYKERFYYRGVWPLLFLPAFLGIKLARITGRVLRSRPGWVARYLAVMPVFLTGLAAWTWGFAQGVFSREE